MMDFHINIFLILTDLLRDHFNNGDVLHCDMY